LIDIKPAFEHVKLTAPTRVDTLPTTGTIAGTAVGQIQSPNLSKFQPQ